MTTYGVTDTGFVLKRLSQILSDMVSILSTVQDPISGEALTLNLTDENDPLVQIINAHSAALSESWEQLQLAYNQFDPLKATGAGLSGLVQLNGLRRRAGIKSTVTLNLTGTIGKSVPAGKTVTDMNNTYTWVLPAWVFDGSGEATVTVTASEYGVLAAVAGTLVKIVTPYSGWTSVTNPLAAVEGTEEETDTELRVRQQESTAAGTSTIESIYSALLELEDVTYAKVYQNITDTTDSRGIPAHTVVPVLLGGTDADIGDILHSHMPLGTPTYGSSFITVTDVQGIEYVYYFTRPTEIPIFVDITIEVVNTDVWPADGAAQIKAAILAYAQYGRAGINVTEGFDPDGYPPGQSVYSSDIYTPMNYVQGHRVVSVFIGTSLSPSDFSVVIDWNEQAIFSAVNINITVS